MPISRSIPHKNSGMKLNVIFYVCLLTALAGSGTAAAQIKKSTKAVEGHSVVHPSVAWKQEIEDGRLLVSKSDCLGCHQTENKMVGPSYVDIAKMYPQTDASIAALSRKIIAGGSGKWGQVPMSPHPGITAPDAKKMVMYILSLKPVSAKLGKNGK